MHEEANRLSGSISDDRPVFATGLGKRDSGFGSYGALQTGRLSNLANLSDARLTDLKLAAETIERISNLSQSTFLIGQHGTYPLGGGGLGSLTGNTRNTSNDGSSTSIGPNTASTTGSKSASTNCGTVQFGNLGSLNNGNEDLFARLSSLSNGGNQGGLGSRSSFSLSNLGSRHSFSQPLTQFSTGKYSGANLPSFSTGTGGAPSFSTGMSSSSQIGGSNGLNLGGSSIGNDPLPRFTDMNILGRLSNLNHSGIGRFTGFTSDLGRGSMNFGRFSSFPSDLGISSHGVGGGIDSSNKANHPDLSLNRSGSPSNGNSINSSLSFNLSGRPIYGLTETEDTKLGEEDDDDGPLPPSPAGSRVGEGSYNRSSQPPKFIVGLNSLDLFMSFTREYPNPTNPGEVIYDTKDILSRECYEAWIKTRRNSLKKPEESFRRALTAHVTGADRRRPFPPKVEDSLLKELRKQQTWACFDGRLSSDGKEVKIGEQGFRTMGYHEKRKFEAADSESQGVAVTGNRFLAGNSFLHKVSAGMDDDGEDHEEQQLVFQQPSLQIPEIKAEPIKQEKPSLARRLSDKVSNLLPQSWYRSLNEPHGVSKRKREDDAGFNDVVVSPSKRTLQSQHA